MHAILALAVGLSILSFAGLRVRFCFYLLVC